MSQKLPAYAMFNNSLGIARFQLAFLSWQMLLEQRDSHLVAGNLWIFMELLNQPEL